MIEYVIHPATDMAPVALLFRAYAASLDVDLSYQGFEAELAGLPGAYAPPAGALLLATSPAGEPVGCVAVRPMAKPGACELTRLQVDPAARGSGLGRALAVAAMGAAQRAGYQTICLDTLPSMHAAQHLYRSLGFETTAPYYNTPVAGTIFMRKPLHA